MVRLRQDTNEPLYYAEGATIYQRPIKVKKGITMGFAVCIVCDGVDPNEVAAVLNRGEKS